MGLLVEPPPTAEQVVDDPPAAVAMIVSLRDRVRALEAEVVSVKTERAVLAAGLADVKARFDAAQLAYGAELGELRASARIRDVQRLKRDNARLREVGSQLLRSAPPGDREKWNQAKNAEPPGRGR